MFDTYKFEIADPLKGFDFNNGVLTKSLNTDISLREAIQTITIELHDAIEKYELKLTDKFNYENGEINRNLDETKTYSDLVLIFSQFHSNLKVLQFDLIIQLNNNKLYIEGMLATVIKNLGAIAKPITKEYALKILKDNGIYKSENGSILTESNLALVLFIGEHDGVLEPYWLLQDEGEEEMFADLLISIKDGSLRSTH